MSASSPKADVFPLADADACVKCGLCLPHCPTYKLSRDEGESPRGRIALMQGLAGGALEPDARLRGHLDRCLSCRACEPVCPARVPYGRLIDAARHELFRRGDRERPAVRLVRRLAPRRRFWRLLGLFTRLAQRLGLTGRLPPYRHLSAPVLRPGTEHAPHGAERGRVSLFLGCVAEPFDTGVQRAALRVLTRLGWRVRVPAAQTCCGALHWHAGDRATARRLARKNLAAFGDGLPVLSTATGCGAQLGEYPEVLGEAGRELGVRHLDINRFLAEADWPGDLAPQPLALRVAVQLPCTQRNVLREPDSVPRLLARIPGLELVPLAHRDCCGAAGSYFLNQPDNARRLGEKLAAAVADCGAGIVVSANIGCAMQLRAACRRAGLRVEVLHPLELLARQLP